MEEPISLFKEDPTIAAEDAMNAAFLAGFAEALVLLINLKETPPCLVLSSDDILEHFRMHDQRLRDEFHSRQRPVEEKLGVDALRRRVDETLRRITI